MNARSLLPASLIAATLVAPAIHAPATAQPIDVLSLASGRSTTIDAPGLTRVAVGDGRIAGVVPVGTQQVIVNAKGPGHTTVIVWSRAGRREYDVTVTEQTLDDLAQMLRTTIDQPGIQVEPIGNTIVVKGSVPDQARANRIADLVGRFRGRGGGGKAGAGYDIIDAVTVTRPLGDLQNALARSADARDVRVDYDNQGNVIVSGTVRDRAAAEAVLQRVRSLSGTMLAANGKVIDRLVTDVTQEIDTHVYVLEIDKTGLQQLGVRLQGSFVDTSGQVHYNDPSFPVFENPADVGARGRGTTIGRWVRAEFLAPTLDLLLQRGNARILSAPNLVTMPGAKANYLVGGEIPYIVPSGLGVVNVLWKEYGVRLEITPTILPDGSIRSVLTPEVSQLDFQNGITVAGFTEPAFRTSRITTDIVSKPGESIIMAGLLNRVESRTVFKIPGLSALPVLGKLFQSTRYQTADTDVVFVMTPEVITR